MTVVLDASAAIHLILNGPRAATVSAAIETGAITLAPDLYVAEVANTLWKYVRAGRLDLDTARDSLRCDRAGHAPRPQFRARH